MEHYELCDRNKNLKRYLEEVKKRISPNHMTEEQLLSYALENYKTPEMYGEFNDFCLLSEDEDKKRDALFTERKKKIEEIENLREQIEVLMRQEEELSSELRNINMDICEIEGHRLSYMIYDKTYLERKCLVCGQIVTPQTITDKDVVVKGETDLPIGLAYIKK